jgi:crotonobetainyl-CoA:carnitine CoA-transferase CaiB-like acyl-CoA transferase
VPHSPAYDSNEALDDPQAVHLNIKVDAEHPTMGRFTTVRAPYSFDGKADLDVLPPPTLDEHGTEIRDEVSRRKAG